ncbi:unnamed protein product [Tenebrio molitor]|nr:unnamed protein product [Tenebrio molitor]
MTYTGIPFKNKISITNSNGNSVKITNMGYKMGNCKYNRVKNKLRPRI